MTSIRKIVVSDLSAPTTPTVFLDVTGTSAIYVSWTAATDNVGVQGYYLQRTSDGANYTDLPAPASRTYSDSGLTPNTGYTYRVAAFDKAGNIGGYGTAQATTLSGTLWQTIPEGPTFTQAATSASPEYWSFAAYAPSEYTSFTLSPSRAGVTVDSANKRLVYDGSGQTGSVSGYALTGAAFSLPGSLPTLTLSGGGTGKAWTFGQAFKKGDVPSGYYISATGPSNFQAEVRNRWDDGSVKFAVLSGIGGTSAVLSAVQGTAPTGEVALVDPQASVEFAGDVTGIYNCPVFDTVSPWDKSTAHLVRKISGPVMTERHYYVPTTDDHVAVWFYVRSYAGGATEVEIVVESGWFDVASPVDKTYGVTVTVNGTTRYSNTLTHYPRTRWATINWVDGTNGLTDYERVIPIHDSTYLRSTKMVPNCATAARSTEIASFVTSITPYGIANLSTSLGAAGYSRWIGLLPLWDAAHVASPSETTYKAVMANGYAYNAWDAYYRDENTGRLLAFSDRKLVNISGWTGAAIGITKPVDAVTSNAATYGGGTLTHQPAAGYLCYLLTGRWSTAETTAFWAAAGHMYCKPTERGLTSTDGSTASHFQEAIRGRAWHSRQIAMALNSLPDSGPTAADQHVRDDMMTAFAGTYTKWASISFDNSLGLLGPLYNPGAYSDSIVLPDLGYPYFQAYFATQSVGFQWDQEHLSGADSSNHQAVRDHLYKVPVGMLGDSNGWCYRYGPQYVAAVGTYDGSTITYDSTWKQAFDRSCNATGSGAIGTPQPCTAGATILSGNFPSATSYGGNLLPAIVYAVDHGAPGAVEAYARLTGASNYSDFVADFPDAPHFAVEPR